MSIQKDQDWLYSHLQETRLKQQSGNLTNHELNKAANESMTSTFNSRTEDIEHGYENIIEELKKGAVGGKFSSSDQTPTITVEDCILSESAKKQLLFGHIYKDSHQHSSFYSNDMLINFYEIAVGMFRDGRMTEAKNAFSFLSKICSRVPSFWIGLGLSLESQKKFSDAIEAFQNAIKVNACELKAYHGVLRCCDNLNDFINIKNLLNAQIDNPQMHDHVVEILNYITKVERG